MNAAQMVAVADQTAPMAWSWPNLPMDVRINLLQVAVAVYEAEPPRGLREGATGAELRRALGVYAARPWAELPFDVAVGVLLAVNT